MKVRDIMLQPPQVCRLETDLGIVSRRMTIAGCGTVVVLDHRGRVAGILTDRDLASAIGRTNRPAAHVLAHEVMTHPVHTVKPDDGVRTALERMMSARVRRLPVVDEDRDLKGVISVDDIILWGLQQGGVTRSDLVATLRAISWAHYPDVEGNCAV